MKSRAHYAALLAKPRPPQIDWLIKRLLRINKRPCPFELVCFHALQISWFVNMLRASDANAGYDIRRGATRKPAKRGISNDLIKLDRIARRAACSDTPIWRQRWLEAWAAVSGTTRGSVWKPIAPPVVKRTFDKLGKLISFERASLQNVVTYSGVNYSFIAPRPADAIPLITQARQRLNAAPVAVRRVRKRNIAADDLIIVIKAAYLELTGRVGVTVDPYVDGRISLKGGLIELGRDIDQHFKLKIATRVRSRPRGS